MSLAIQLIVDGYVRLKDRVALERMHEHWRKMLQECRASAANGFRVEALDAALQNEINVLDEALSRLLLSSTDKKQW
jgi:hypothetical protein